MTKREAGLWIIGMSVAALCLSFWTNYEVPPGAPIDFIAYVIGGVLGGAIGLMLVSGLIPLIWWGRHRFRLAKAARPFKL